MENARAALLLTTALTGQGGFASAALNTLINPQSAIYTLAASVTVPIFDGYRLMSQLDLQKGRRTELLKLYRKAIISGFTDVERARIAAQTWPSRRGCKARQLRRAARL